MKLKLDKMKSTKRTIGKSKTMPKIIIGLILAVLLIIAGCSKSTLQGTKATVYKGFSCGCCEVYSSYLSKRGFTVNEFNSNGNDPSNIKEKVGVPSSLQTCHTTIIGDYFIEGHMPLEAIEKLMSEKPNIKGIALPGMPSGSPGMPGAKAETWIIYAVNKDGSTSEFMRL